MFAIETLQRVHIMGYFDYNFSFQINWYSVRNCCASQLLIKITDNKMKIFVVNYFPSSLPRYQIVSNFPFNKSWPTGCRGSARDMFDSSNLPLGQKALPAYLRHLDDVYILRVYDNLYNDSALIVCMSR